jgi:DinB superfamily
MNSQQLATQAAVNSWKITVGRADKIFSPLTADQLQQQIAPGKNRLIYLLGHLTAVHDRMLPLLGLGEQLHPELDEPFITKPDREVAQLPPVDELKKYWAEVNNALLNKFTALSAEEWLQRHTAMTDEDYAKDPMRNRLSVLLSRTNHLSFHIGQIILTPK